jgi:hypothetical protein
MLHAIRQLRCLIQDFAKTACQNILYYESEGYKFGYAYARLMVSLLGPRQQKKRITVRRSFLHKSSMAHSYRISELSSLHRFIRIIHGMSNGTLVALVRS